MALIPCGYKVVDQKEWEREFTRKSRDFGEDFTKSGGDPKIGERLNELASANMYLMENPTCCVYCISDSGIPSILVYDSPKEALEAISNWKELVSAYT